MLGRYIEINNIVMPNPVSFEYQYNPDENVFTTEAGTQMTNIRRLDRLSFSASFNCSSTLKTTIETLVLTQAVTVSLDHGSPVSGRLRLGGAITLVENSERTPNTQGLWKVPVTFEGE